jgi:hypothetical protein
MLWTIEAAHYPADLFNISEISEVLYEFDGPRIFTTSHAGLLYFWYECGEDVDSRIWRYLVTPTDKVFIAKLKTGSRTVYDALSLSWLWAVDVDDSDSIAAAWVLPDLDAVPANAKPEKDVFLWPHLQPLLTYRLIGEGLSEGNVPASIVARAMEQPISALKRLLEISSYTVAPGRPHESFRREYDLSARHFAYNSFEVSFGLTIDPDNSQDQQALSIYQASAKSLSTALSWLNSEARENIPDTGLLTVLKDLSPPAHGQVERVELRGQLIVQDTPVVLTRENRLFVSKAIRQQLSLERQFKNVIGRIGEFDKDNFSLILRDTDTSDAELNCSFSEELYDDLFEAFTSDSRINIVVHQTQAGRQVEIKAVQLVLNEMLPKFGEPVQTLSGQK